jgi:hypothetical protein
MWCGLEDVAQESTISGIPNGLQHTVVYIQRDQMKEHTPNFCHLNIQTVMFSTGLKQFTLKKQLDIFMLVLFCSTTLVYEGGFAERQVSLNKNHHYQGGFY